MTLFHCRGYSDWYCPYLYFIRIASIQLTINSYRHYLIYFNIIQPSTKKSMVINGLRRIMTNHHLTVNFNVKHFAFHLALKCFKIYGGKLVLAIQCHSQQSHSTMTPSRYVPLCFHVLGLVERQIATRSSQQDIHGYSGGRFHVGQREDGVLVGCPEERPAEKPTWGNHPKMTFSTCTLVCLKMDDIG